MNEKYYIEIPREGAKKLSGGGWDSSIVRKATAKEILEARELYNNNECNHSLVKDEDGFLYTIRSCALCGKGLGAL